MRSIRFDAAVVASSAIAMSAGMFLGFIGDLEVHSAIVFAGLTLCAVLAAAYAAPRAGADHGARMPPPFVFELSILLLFGRNAVVLVTASAALVAGLGRWRFAHPWRRLAVTTLVSTLSIAAAALAHDALAPLVADAAWPLSPAPAIAAGVAFALVTSAAIDFLVPLALTRSVNRSWGRELLASAPSYLVGTAAAIAIVELVQRQAWLVLALTVPPLWVLFRGHIDSLERRADDHRRAQVRDSITEAMCVVDTSGSVVSWDAGLDAIVGCGCDRALGRPLVAAVPALNTPEVRLAMEEASASRTARMLVVAIAGSPSPRTVEVTLLPVDGGLTLLWHDVSRRLQTERAARRHEERLTLAAEGANDGLWEWDLRTQEFYVSGRWRAMLGAATRAAIVRSEEFTDRVHPEDAPAMREAVDAHVVGKTDVLAHECRLRHDDGSYRWFLVRSTAVRGAGRRAVRIAGSITDTTEHAAAQERLRSAEFVDPLTGLTNRAVFVERLGRRLDDLKQRRFSRWFAVLYLDLDRFKVVNDSLGHLVGDELLIAASRRLESCLRSGDALARLGGDEFAILLNELDNEEQANAIAFRIQETLSSPFAIGGREVFTSASIGIAFGVADYAGPEDIMRDADTAMYHAKSRGKARHELFDADMHARARTRLGLENDLRRAINNNDFEVHYQPIVSLASRMCVGFESLVRWTRNGEPVSPAIFVPIAEELGLIEPLGTWVMQEACRTFADWRRRHPDAGLECITVNASSRQLMQQNFMRVVEQAVAKARLNPRDLRIEITETALMDSPNIAAEVLRELRDFGVKIYLDDFGTGYSSLSHLHKLPVDALKIDRSFVRSLALPDRPAIVESILGLARTLNTSVVAEGIEDDVQARELERLGCTHAQGFLFSKPIPTQKVEEILTARLPLGPARVDHPSMMAAAS